MNSHGILSRKVLVLNQSYEPLMVINAKRAIILVIKDKVEMLEDTVPLPITTLPIATTFAKIGDKIVLDPTSEEEAIMDARLTLVTDSNGNFVAGQKGRPGLFTIEEMTALAVTAKEKGAEIRKEIMDATGIGT